MWLTLFICPIINSSFITGTEIGPVEVYVSKVKCSYTTIVLFDNNWAFFKKNMINEWH